MATCNLLAFTIFTLWPCMPPRLLSSPNVTGPSGAEARSYGFVDTVHGSAGESSVWTQNRFCNQYAAMPSLHFGYALLIGLTVMSIPLAQTQTRTQTQTQAQARGRVLVLRVPRTGARLLRCRVPSWRRAACVALGVAYPAVILVAIVATANHFVLDAVAGAVVWPGQLPPLGPACRELRMRGDFGSDLPSLLEFAAATGAAEVQVTSGWSEELAQAFSRRGLRALPLGPPEQIRLFR